MEDRGVNPAAVPVVVIISVTSLVVGSYCVASKGSGGGGKYGNPEDAIQTYFDAYNNRDAYILYESLSSDASKTVTESQVEMFLHIKKEENMKTEINNINVEISGDTATAQIEVTKAYSFSDEKEKYQRTYNTPLVKKDGEWKIDEYPVA